VVRFRVWLITICALGALTSVFVSQAQQTDEGKPILKARAVDSETPTPTPKSKASPHKKKKSSSPSPSAKAKKKKTPTEESEASPTPGETPEASPKAKTKKSPAKETSPKGKKKKKTEKSPSPRKKTSPKPSETPEAGATATPPRAIAVPSPGAPPSPVPRAKSALAAPVEEPEQLTIEKYGYEKPRGFWARLFGGGGRGSGSGAGYRYLTSSVRAQIDRAPVTRGRWQYIVVHNSGTRQGNAAAFDYYHRHFRRMQNGLAYHFVIGNGTSTGNGQIEIGDRWRRQINGGHVHSDYLNNIALGICLVGDFNRDQPTRAQLDCCEELIRYLRQRCGKIDSGHYPIVKPHRDINPPRWPTDCPGDVFPYSWFRRFQE
jgi:N-acetylmuramoyl-L-alanine amidase-like protein